MNKIPNMVFNFAASLVIGGIVGGLVTVGYLYKTEDTVEVRPSENTAVNTLAITPENTFPAIKRASIGFNYDLICASWSGETENKDVIFLVRLPGDPVDKFRMLSIGNFGWTANKKLYFAEINNEHIQSLEVVYPDITGLTCE